MTSSEFRDVVLETLVLFLVTWFDRQPIHAAAVVRDKIALLLAGPSGVGKSSLAYAAASAGMELLSDDVVYVQLEDHRRLWPLARQVRLPADAGTLFPELSGIEPMLQGNGKQKVLVDLNTTGTRLRPGIDGPVGVCVLLRTSRTAASLEPLSLAEARERLTADLEPGFDRFADDPAEMLTRLPIVATWHLALGQRPADAVPLLVSALDSLTRRE